MCMPTAPAQKLQFSELPVKLVKSPLDLATPISYVVRYFSDRQVSDPYRRVRELSES